MGKLEHKGLFALREILFVLQKNLSTRNHFQCERFFSSTKILSSVTKLQRDRRVALEAYNFLSSEKIYCSVTATLQRVIIFRNRYHTKCYCVRDPIYRRQMSTEKGFREVTLVHVDFKPGFYRSRKCPIRVKTTTTSTYVEQLS